MSDIAPSLQSTLRLRRYARRFAESSRIRIRVLAVVLFIVAGLLLPFFADPVKTGLTGRYYRNTEWEGTPFFSVREQYLNLDRMKSYFPEITTYYSIEWTGAIDIPESGDYQFSTTSDDGSEIFIDGQRVVDNSGIHGFQERSGSLYLEHGFYPITVRYMQAAEAAECQVYWTPPGASREDFSQATFFTKLPTEHHLHIHRLLNMVWGVCGVCGVLGMGFMLLVWLKSRDILRPFLRNTLMGRMFARFHRVLKRPDSLKHAYPSSPEPGILRDSLLAVCGYSVLTGFWTYPLIRKFSTEMAGLGGDRYIYLWNMWWLKKALLELHTNPLFTDYIFYPQGLGLGFHDFSILNAFFSIPLQGLFSFQEIYNLLFLLTFIVGGLGGFLLVRYLTGDSLAGFFAGMVFVFWGARIYNVDHLSLASIQWFPFCALYLFKTLRESSYRNPLLLALFLVFNALSSLYYAVYMVLFVGLFLVYCLWQERKIFCATACLTRFLLAGFLATLVMLPMLLPMLAEVFEGQEYINSPVLIEESASPHLLFFPNVNHAILGKYVRYLYERCDIPIQWGLTGGSFLGYTVLVLSLYAILKLKHLNKAFWILTGLVFLILACGPHPRIFSTFYTNIPLPYQLFQHIPILKALRIPIRFLMVVMLCVSVLSGYACWDLFRRFRGRYVLFTVLSAALLFEFLRVFFVNPIEPTPAFYKTLGQDTETYAILELTRQMNWVHSSVRSSLFQISHEKKLFHGHASRVSPETYQQAYLLYPVIDDFLMLPQEQAEHATTLRDTQERICALLSYYDVRYVTLYSDYPRGSYEDNLDRLTLLFGEPVDTQSEVFWQFGTSQAKQPDMALFNVEYRPLAGNIIFPGTGMRPLDYQQEIPYRVTGRFADYKVLNVENASGMTLHLQGKAYKLPEEQVNIFSNGEFLTTATVSEWTDLTIPSVPLKPGENTIRFETLENRDPKYGIYLRDVAAEFIK